MRSMHFQWKQDIIIWDLPAIHAAEDASDDSAACLDTFTVLFNVQSNSSVSIQEKEKKWDEENEEKEGKEDEEKEKGTFV